MQNKEIAELNKQAVGLAAEDILKLAEQIFPGKIIFANSLGAEDQVITHFIANNKLNIPIFTLDTGRQFYESYTLIARTERKYDLKIDVFFPESDEVEEMVNKHGINLFYESVEMRKLCCEVRKTRPLQRALKGNEAWICGLRKEQAVTRTDIDIFEWDENNGLIKINPLADWTEEKLWQFVKENDVTYNLLHDKGFRSIGCAPCTRAAASDADVRSGRWWWENPDTKECGLHNKPAG
ncbi:MAG: phosphoadenylyl-sulfate reductase [Bacteroidetes bacterium]|nr:phosphoadenylyl-sulfate reductase [Bacteroidota bacterium]MBU1720240.1 phosphoadenylyl-sulfate reductase [Bacteroidota bacterium]